MNELANVTEQKLFDAIHTSAVPAISRQQETFVLESPVSDWERTDAIETIIAGLREGDILTLTHETDVEYCTISVTDKFENRLSERRELQDNRAVNGRGKAVQGSAFAERAGIQRARKAISRAYGTQKNGMLSEY